MANLIRHSSDKDKGGAAASAAVASDSPNGWPDPEVLAFAQCRGNALVYGRRGLILARNADGTYKVEIVSKKKKKKKKKGACPSEVQERVHRSRLLWRFSLARQTDFNHING